MSNEIRAVVEKAIQQIAQQHQLQLPPLQPGTVLVDELGFTSWTVVALLASLEETLGVDPLEDEDVMIADLRTVGDLCRVFANSLARAG